MSLKKYNVIELTNEEMIDIDGGQIIGSGLIVLLVFLKRLEAFIDGFL